MYTPKPWYRAERCVYALVQCGWRKGVEQFKNRFSIHFNKDNECPIEELEATVALVQKSPDLVDSIKGLLSIIDKSGNATLIHHTTTIEARELLQTLGVTNHG